ncbi:AcrR family transcriptional regulator [Streptomyces pristinaespiralis]|uniref:TetR-type regulator n=1 Tax=Streptomyces pristinaespiralis TaxID=38300 RepID=A0A0M3QGY7_STRPR|nr:TetR-type regulator [Streptomyces pristinaespiralis]ALC25342.1 TetR-type regulator [Streptomyces pristinaespiralis]
MNGEEKGETGMQARSERTRRRLVLAGAQMFDRYGYASATLGQIAGAAGMTKGALYFHFASKEGLADAVQERGRQLLCDFVQQQWEAGAAPLQALIDLTHWLADALYQDPVVRAGLRITNERAGRHPAATDFHQTWITEVLRLLGQAAAAGDLREDAAGEGGQSLLTAAVCGIGVLAGTGLTPTELAHRVHALWQPLLPALVPPGHTPRYRTHPPTTTHTRPAHAA